MSVLTIFNHGTGVDQNVRHHNITKLYNETSTAVQDNAFVTQGVGSTHRTLRSVPLVGNLAALVGGNLFGYDNGSAEGAAISWVTSRYQQLNGLVNGINICGYSRGAATCFKQANLLSKNTNKGIRDIPVCIFAIDPVPGCMGKLNSHMYRDLELKDNIDEVFVLLAECERRKTFRPVLHAEIVDGHMGRFKWDTMPGNHCGIVEQKAEGDVGCDSPFLVYDLAKDKLRYWGSRFSVQNDMPQEEQLGRYARIMLQFDEYIKMGQQKSERLMGGMTTNRVPRQMTENANTGFAKDNWHGGAIKIKSPKVGTSSRYFANNQHRDLFTAKFGLAGATLCKLERGVTAEDYMKLKVSNSPERMSLNPFFESGPWGQLASQHFDAYLKVVASL